MITVRDKLMEAASTQAERDLIAAWLAEDRDGFCARQRAWERVRARSSLGRLQFNW